MTACAVCAVCGLETSECIARHGHWRPTQWLCCTPEESSVCMQISAPTAADAARIYAAAKHSDSDDDVIIVCVEVSPLDGSRPDQRFTVIRDRDVDGAWASMPWTPPP